MKFVFRTQPNELISEFIKDLQVNGAPSMTEINDCTILEIRSLRWTPTAPIAIPDSLVGAVIMSDAGYNLGILAKTFPDMYYKITESAKFVLAAFSQSAILHKMATALVSVHLHFFKEADSSAFVDDLLDIASIETRTFEGLSCLITLKPGVPWKFSFRANSLEVLRNVVLLYISDDIDVFDRIQDDVAEAFSDMHGLTHREGSHIQVLLSSEETV